MTRIKAVVFDMDGVLVDAKDWHFEALNQSLELFGFRISQFEHYQIYDGLPTSRKLELLAKNQGFPMSLATFVNQMKQQYFMGIMEQKCVPNDRHQETLHRLCEDGFRLALASNSIRLTVDLLMQRTRLATYMDVTLSNEDVDRAKPDPEIYTLAFNRLGVQPDECLVVEDGAYGIEAAKKAGAHVLVVETVHDVHYRGIQRRISELEGGSAKRRAA
ncbi:Phosphorylated carbohydrates phosphatase [Planctomycetes bacterium CA13]|uniref:Phosphorylated carbohydrates phosphatase n=1 Tax=Novipirellula herctigrandis TaxID=2527986 RepID=A0A5C5Z6I3_9BACT|nr:Phosphorylated carbohydrates phosphatase [Planctomycetes bacterium CA13]